ncbi:serine hydrolase domain-containing protein [Joostella sp.]|uniref:serine hydrolase domain-containing protein n=1 Tax=Joostella sp. TaxID=2231138 RepID=UPI003A90E9C6
MKFNIQNILLILSVYSFLFLVSSCKKETKKTVESKNAFTNDIALDSFFTELTDKGMFNGAVAVKKDGELIFKKGYGIANFKLNTPFLPSTAMEVASVSKQFTAAAIQILAQQNELNINEYAYKYLGDEFPYKEIKVSHLLTHTSGLKDYEEYFKKEWDTTAIAYNQNIVNYFTEQKPPLESTPGEKYHYSNSGFVLLASIVEKVSGKTLDVFLDEQLFKTGHMNNSGFLERDSIWNINNYAPGYMLNPKTCSFDKPELLQGKKYYRFLSGRFGSGRLSTSIDDLLKWDSILHTNTLINEKSKSLAFTPHPPSKDSSDYGFGWHIPDTTAQNRIIYHTGSWAGNKSYIKRFINKKDVVIILNNTNSPYMVPIRKEIDKYVTNGIALTVPPLLGENVLEKEICKLSTDNIKSWYEKNQELKWDQKDLSNLKKFYLKNNEKNKSEIISVLLKLI